MGSDWRPIETAPRDGTCVLLLITNSKRRISTGRWDSQEYHKKPRPFWHVDMWSFGGPETHRGVQPTHWQPLPGPPEREAGDGE